jgi:hypothetical protein
MLKQFLSAAKSIANQCASSKGADPAKLEELASEISVLQRKIDCQDGDLAFAQSILARYSLEIERLIRENVQLRISIAGAKV